MACLHFSSVTLLQTCLSDYDDDDDDEVDDVDDDNYDNDDDCDNDEDQAFDFNCIAKSRNEVNH